MRGRSPALAGPPLMAGAVTIMRLVITPGTALDVTLPGSARSVPVARRLVRDVLAGCPRAGDLVLAVSELATNAVAHSASGRGGMLTVRVRTAPRWARVEVTDDGPAVPPSAGGNGYGLSIVASLTSRTGATFGTAGQRTAWAEVTWPERCRITEG